MSGNATYQDLACRCRSRFFVGSGNLNIHKVRSHFGLKFDPLLQPRAVGFGSGEDADVR